MSKINSLQELYQIMNRTKNIRIDATKEYLSNQNIPSNTIDDLQIILDQIEKIEQINGNYILPMGGQ